MPFLVDPRTLERVRSLELGWNRHGIDPYGARQVDVARMFSVLGWFYRRYFRVTVVGIDHVPPRGRAMLVGNHSGGWALDALMALAANFFDAEKPRLAHGMAEKFLNRLPFSSQMMQRSGHLVGLPEHAVRLLEDERLLMVFPEGARGTAKLYRERESLVKFGTGFLRLAMQTKTPIVPFGFVGGGEAIPSVMNLYKLGQLFGVPYIPVTPYVVAVPLPVALGLEFGPPIRVEGTGDEPDDVIEAKVDAVKRAIARLIASASARRKART